MDKKNVNLRREVFFSDVDKIIKWLNDSEVTKFLNERQNVKESLIRIKRNTNLPILTHLFNQKGSFFMITIPEKGPIGFLRLVPKNQVTEMVIVIGDRTEWGKGFGYKAIIEGLKHAFFNWREDKVIAKINEKNERSKRVFKKAGFINEKKLTKEIQYSLSINKFINLLS